jgi:hypothetical protein
MISIAQNAGKSPFLVVYLPRSTAGRYLFALSEYLCLNVNGLDPLRGPNKARLSDGRVAEEHSAAALELILVII